jgi:hypothetical protein
MGRAASKIISTLYMAHSLIEIFLRQMPISEIFFNYLYHVGACVIIFVNVVRKLSENRASVVRYRYQRNRHRQTKQEYD